MLDLILGENLAAPRGISQAVVASSLGNFRKVSPQESMAAARAKGALLYCPQYEMEEGAYKELFRSEGALVFAFSDLLREEGFRRAILLSKMRLALALVRKSGCGVVTCTLASDGAQLRTARELEAFQSVLGMGQPEKDFAGRTLERLSGKMKK